MKVGDILAESARRWPTRPAIADEGGVLSYQDLPLLSPGNVLFLAHHIAKEVMATTNIFNSIQNTGAGI